MSRDIQIVGVERSGTTWLTCLLHNNFADCWPRWENKHDLPAGLNNFGQRVTIGEQLTARNAAVVAIKKPVDKWLRSICRNPAGLQQRHEELYDGQEIDPIRAKEYHERFYREWAECGVRYYEISYIDLLREPPKILTMLAAKLGLRFNGPPWNLKGTDWRWNERRKEYYLDGNCTLTSQPTAV